MNQPQEDPGLPYELKFVVHPPHEDFCITKLVILSEARNLELYINGGYEKSSRGVMLTMNKGRWLNYYPILQCTIQIYHYCVLSIYIYSYVVFFFKDIYKLDKVTSKRGWFWPV